MSKSIRMEMIAMVIAIQLSACAPAQPATAALTAASTEISIPPDLDNARPLVHWLEEAGAAVLDVQYSTEGSLLQSASQAAWIKTDKGIADAVFFLDPAGTMDIQVTPLQGQEPGRSLYRLQAPPPAMLRPVTIDAAYPLYFIVRRGMFIETNSEVLDRILQRLPMDSSNTPMPSSTMTAAGP